MKKFLFDTNDFDETETQVEVPTFSEDQLRLAREQSLTQGRDEGIAQARELLEQKISNALEKIGQQVGAMAAREDARDTQMHIDAAKLALKVTHKLVPAFAQKFSFEEIERVILQALEQRRDEPRIAVTVSPQHLEALKDRIDALALEKGFAGKVIVVSDDAMAAGDVRAEWADGGIERIYERIYAQIEDEFQKAITGMEHAVDTDKSE